MEVFIISDYQCCTQWGFDIYQKMFSGVLMFDKNAREIGIPSNMLLDFDMRYTGATDYY